MAKCLKIIIGSNLCNLVTISSNLIYLVSSPLSFNMGQAPSSQESIHAHVTGVTPHTNLCHTFLGTLGTALLRHSSHGITTLPHTSLSTSKYLGGAKYMLGACQVGKNFFLTKMYLYLDFIKSSHFS